MAEYITGGAQTTINSTITELYPALAFNNNEKFTSVDDFQKFVIALVDKDKLFTGKSRLSFVNKSNAESAKELIYDTNNIRPEMRDEKISNAIGILNYLYEQDKIRTIDKVVWGYREKPEGVPNNHAGDIFIFYKSKQKPQILGVSLKAGSKTSKEPKLNSYVRSTILKDYWKRKIPNAEKNLRDSLWKNVYSQLHSLDKKKVNQNNWIDISGKNQKPNPEVVNAVLRTFKQKQSLFERLYVEQNKTSRQQLVKMINSNFDTALEWIENEFRLEKPKEEYGMKQDAAGYWRYTEGPSKGERVFVGVEKPDPLPDIKDEASLRKEFNSQSDYFKGIAQAFGKVAATDPTAAGDVSLIFAYMKMLDPGSVVREGEQATAANARGVPEGILNLYNRVITGEKLTENQRKDFRKQAQNIYELALDDQSLNVSRYKDIAERKGFDPDVIVFDYSEGIQPLIFEMSLKEKSLQDLQNLDVANYTEEQLEIIAKVLAEKLGGS